MPVRQFATADEFVNHKTQESGGRFFKTWRDPDKDVSTIDLFLHATQKPVVVWVHKVPKIVVLEDRDTKEKTRRVFGGDWPCWEAEELLIKQHFRYRDSGERKVPPTTCGLCKLWDWVRLELWEGRLKLSTPVFRFDGDKKDDTVVVHAGGLAGAFKGDKLNDAQKLEIREAGISLKEGFREAFAAQATYVFTLVNVEKPEDGVIVLQESSGLGDKVQQVIADAMNPKALGREKGDPFKHPYAMQWRYSRKETPANKYTAQRLDGVRLTPKIEKLIRDPKTAPPLDEMLAEFNQASMRAYLERHCVLPKGRVPWEKLFAQDERGTAAARAEREVEDRRREGMPEVDTREELPINDGLGPLSEPDADGAVYDANGDEVARCEECGRLMLMRAASCPHCGHAYEEAEPEPETPPPPPPPMRTRGAGKPAAAKPGGGRGATPAPRPEEPAEDDDAIPFARAEFGAGERWAR